eukprot:CAMPEP_0181127470 /NCGR_PEP_ID=MMETSP1071-20121207/28216_1 /TAXON_ID=35127 /ORGANISM="Thalassiosira sp., Strain NH16" /LENGTH=132 /DNA_ID=CAMNT_0023213213 /DNA_START=37 /DNA_END=436 /DNA_ORIENTATION=+
MKLISALALLFTCHASATVVENVEDSNKNKPFVVTKPFNFLLRGAVHADVLADDQCCATPEGGCAVGGDDCPPSLSQISAASEQRSMSLPDESDVAGHFRGHPRLLSDVQSSGVERCPRPTEESLDASFLGR